MIAGYQGSRAERLTGFGSPGSTRSVRKVRLEAGLQPAQRLLAGAVRLFFDLLVLGLIGLAGLETLRRRAAAALVYRPGRGGSSPRPRPQAPAAGHSHGRGD